MHGGGTARHGSIAHHGRCQQPWHPANQCLQPLTPAQRCAASAARERCKTSAQPRCSRAGCPAWPAGGQRASVAQRQGISCCARHDPSCPLIASAWQLQCSPESADILLQPPIQPSPAQARPKPMRARLHEVALAPCGRHLAPLAGQQVDHLHSHQLQSGQDRKRSSWVKAPFRKLGSDPGLYTVARAHTAAVRGQAAPHLAGGLAAGAVHSAKVARAEGCLEDVALRQGHPILCQARAPPWRGRRSRRAGLVAV